jgi:hypothetical protein
MLDMSTLGAAADVKFGNFGKFQDTERFFIPYPRHVSSRLPPSDKTCKYATAPSTQTHKRKKTWRDSLLIYTLLSAVSVLVVAQRSSEIPEGLMNNPVLHILSVCLQQYACAVIILSYAACPSQQYFSPLSHKRPDFRGKKVFEHKMCFDFSKT